MVEKQLFVKGARMHNLKNIDVAIPRDSFTVITGLSGSGKSSLAFDTIFAEGQRRYVESLSAYARQFLEQMTKPEVEWIEGLSPAISIDQKSRSRNPRSTVGTVTEIHDYLRLLFARIGKSHCPDCGDPISKLTAERITELILELPARSKVIILAPLVKDRKGEHHKLIEELANQGISKIRINGEILAIEDVPEFEKYKRVKLDAVIDRLILGKKGRSRLTEAVERALEMGGGEMRLHMIKEGADRKYSERFACPKCGRGFAEPQPRNFSFNSPHGACDDCTGLGTRKEPDPALLVVDPELSLRDGAIMGRSLNTDAWRRQSWEQIAQHFDIDLDMPVKDLSKAHLDVFLYGSGQEKILFKYLHEGKNSTWEYEAEQPSKGVIYNVRRLYNQTQSDRQREWYASFMSEVDCSTCHGQRLRPESLAVTIARRNIADLSNLSVKEAKRFFEFVDLDERDMFIGHEVLKEIRERLSFLVDVGLDYLTLDRRSASLSGGESQRIRLATQIGSKLVGVLYILDEPSIGLHQRDNNRLIRTLKSLQSLGNTLIVVEHDEETILSADHVIDLGPGAGEHGGEVVAAGTPAEIMRSKRSITGRFLSGKESIAVPERRRESNGNSIFITGAAENNLKGIDVRIPLGMLVLVTGVSGSGKSSLVNEILYKALARRLNRSKIRPGKHQAVEGLHHLDKVINIDQSPIGRTPRSNPATYTKLYGDIRDLFARTAEARARGYKPGRFSFNVKGGRCESCQGAGMVKIEMHFLPDIHVQCEDCEGRRYNEETLSVHYKGKSISDVLDMTIEEAVGFFAPIPSAQRKLQTMFDVGLGYIRLGQPATTLSGGEAQRVKLATELAKRATGRTLYILDEPTTGLHFADVKKLMQVLHRLADEGNSLVVIEHNLDVIKQADWMIDLGPEGGERGGRIVAEGTPEQVARQKKGHTAPFLKAALK